jgi:tetratricopeptide (TPR) repeat protein
MYSSADKLDEAEKSFATARKIMEELADDYPGELGYRSTLGGILNNLGLIQEKSGKLDEAKVLFEEAIAQQRRALENSPQVAQYRQYLGKHYANYRRVLRALQRWDADAATALAEVELFGDDPEELYRVGLELAAAAAAKESAENPAAANADIRQRYRDQTVSALAKAIGAGLKRPERIRDEPRLEFLRADANFDKLLEGLQHRKN